MDIKKYVEEAVEFIPIEDVNDFLQKSGCIPDGFSLDALIDKLPRTCPDHRMTELQDKIKLLPGLMLKGVIGKDYFRATKRKQMPIIALWQVVSRAIPAKELDTVCFLDALEESSLWQAKYEIPELERIRKYEFVCNEHAAVLGQMFYNITRDKSVFNDYGFTDAQKIKQLDAEWKEFLAESPAPKMAGYGEEIWCGRVEYNLLPEEFLQWRKNRAVSNRLVEAGITEEFIQNARQMEGKKYVQANGAILQLISARKDEQPMRFSEFLRITRIPNGDLALYRANDFVRAYDEIKSRSWIDYEQAKQEYPGFGNALSRFCVFRGLILLSPVNKIPKKGFLPPEEYREWRKATETFSNKYHFGSIKAVAEAPQEFVYDVCFASSMQEIDRGITRELDELSRRMTETDYALLLSACEQNQEIAILIGDERLKNARELLYDISSYYGRIKIKTSSVFAPNKELPA